MPESQYDTRLVREHEEKFIGWELRFIAEGRPACETTTYIFTENHKYLTCKFTFCTAELVAGFSKGESVRPFAIRFFENTTANVNAIIAIVRIIFSFLEGEVGEGVQREYALSLSNRRCASRIKFDSRIDFVPR